METVGHAHDPHRYAGIVVVTGDRGNDVKSVASVLNEIGVGGLNIEIATDNEPYLMELVAKGLSKSNARAYHWRNISEHGPQAKGVERAVGIAKEGIYTNWQSALHFRLFGRVCLSNI